MEEFEKVLPEIQAVIARHLNGELAFDAAARSVAEIYKRTVPADPMGSAELAKPEVARRIQLKPLSISQWLSPGVPAGPTIRITSTKPLALAPGRSAEDEKTAWKVLSEALHLLFGSSGSATFELSP